MWETAAAHLKKLQMKFKQSIPHEHFDQCLKNTSAHRP